MLIPNNKTKLKDIFKLAGLPGYLLLGYYVIQFAFARQKLDATAIDGSAIVFASYAMLCTYIGLKELSKNKYSRQFRKKILWNTPLKWFIYYTCFCFISALWSSSFALSAYRAVECFGMLIIMSAAMKVLSENTNKKGIVLWCVTFAFLMLLFTCITSLWQTKNINIMLYVCQFPSTIFFFLALYNAPNNIIRGFICIIALLCKSTTGYMGIAFGLISLLFGNSKYRILGIILLITIGVASYFIGFENLLNNTVFASKGGFDYNNMSGRDVVWSNALQQMFLNHKEWSGYGFVAGERDFAVKWIGPQVIGMHNGYLSAFVGTGIIGFLLFTIFMIKISLQAISRKMPAEFKSLCIASIIVINLHTFANPGLGFRVYGTWMPAMLLVNLICTLTIKKKVSYDHNRNSSL